MAIYKSILTFSLVIGRLGISVCNLRTQQEFEKICLAGEHSKTSCDCIYQRLKHISLQSPVLPQDFAPTF